MKLISSRSKYSKPKMKRGFFSRLSKRERMIFLAPAVAALIAVAVAYFINATAERFELPYDGMRYYAGSAYQITSGSILRRTEDDTTVVELENSEYAIDSLPIYYDENTVLFAQNMVYVDPTTNEFGRLDYFTEVRIEDDGSIYATRDDNEIFLRRGFAYDGEDIYIFFEDVIIEYNGYKMQLPAMSYVEAVFTGDVMVYNSGASEQYMEAPKGDVIIKMDGLEIELSLLEDSIKREDGTKQLLFTRAEVLESMF